MVSIDAKREATENRTAVWCGRTALAFRGRRNRDMSEARRTTPSRSSNHPGGTKSMSTRRVVCPAILAIGVQHRERERSHTTVVRELGQNDGQCALVQSRCAKGHAYKPHECNTVRRCV